MLFKYKINKINIIKPLLFYVSKLLLKSFMKNNKLTSLKLSLINLYILSNNFSHPKIII